jgi:hypothetical protein
MYFVDLAIVADSHQQHDGFGLMSLGGSVVCSHSGARSLDFVHSSSHEKAFFIAQVRTRSITSRVGILFQADSLHRSYVG